MYLAFEPGVVSHLTQIICHVSSLSTQTTRKDKVPYINKPVHVSVHKFV